MSRPSLVAFTILFSCSALACKDEPAEPTSAAAKAPSAAASEPVAEPEPPPEPPQWLLLPWDTKLRVAPEQYAPALTLAPPPKAEGAGEAEEADEAEAESPGRVVKVLGKADEEGRWWKLDAGAALDPGVTGRAIEGLEFYELALYVPAGTGKAIELEPKPEPEPKPATTRVATEARAGAEKDGLVRVLGTNNANVGVLDVLAASSSAPVQSGRARPPGLEHEWVVKAESKVYWPDGSLAGSVARTHAFLEAGETREVGGRELSCFGVRIGPPTKPVTELCFEPESVNMAAPVVSPFDDSSAFGELEGIGAALVELEAIGGLGIDDTGASNTGSNHDGMDGMDGMGGIGVIGNKSGGAYGSGAAGEGQAGMGGFGGRGEADEARP